MAYKNPVPSTNVIIEKDGKILLVLRDAEPFKGKLGLPGGYMDWEETVEQCAIREAKEETNLDVELVDILGVFSHPDRHPGELHTIAITFIAEIVNGEAIAGDDAREIVWKPLDEIKDLAFDHQLMVEKYKEWKKEKKTFWTTR